MDYKLVLSFMLLHYSVSALPESYKQIDIEPDIENDDQETDYEYTLRDEEIKTNSITRKPLPQYEVTEIVIDIPDNRTKGPIVTNYTIYRPLNTVLTTDKETESINKTDCRDDNKKTTLSLDKSSEGKNSYISIFHVKAEFEDKTKVTPPIVDVHHITHAPGIRDYLHGIKQGIVNGFNSIIHKYKHSDEIETPGPLTFLSKLHKKSTETAHKIHDVVFGHTVDDV